jgi:AcrR family transcriptional regulator
VSDSSNPASEGVDSRRTKARERTERQRDRILQAAKACFVEHGFHAASMANIAEAAQMSPGLIYRYFASKNAIILAIIERQLQDSRAGIEALNLGSDLANRLGEVFAKLQVADEEFMNPALYLEMSAQASRDPQIARALADSDQATRGELAGWLGRVARGAGRAVDPQEVEARSLVLQCIFEGLVVRAVREPKLDAAQMARGLQAFIPLLSEGGAAPARAPTREF